MKPFAALLAFALAMAAGQRSANRGYGAPTQPFNPPVQPQQPSYQPQGGGASLAQGQHDHQGLDWLLESVPGQPGTDYPIYSQEQLGGFNFECNGQVEGGYYADPASQCQAFHVCIPDGLGGLGTLSFLCPNGTIFNQEYFICDWWFNFDCSQATGLYGRNDEVARERESASLAAASNQRNSYSQPAPAQSFRNAAPQPIQNSFSQPAQNNYAQPAQASYGAGRR